MAGAALAIVGVALFVDSWMTADAWWSGWWPQAFSRSSAGFWNVVFALMLPSIGVSVWRMRNADADERRRVWWFLAVLAAGMMPIFLVGALLGVSVSFRELMASPRLLRTAVEVGALSPCCRFPSPRPTRFWRTGRSRCGSPFGRPCATRSRDTR